MRQVGQNLAIKITWQRKRWKMVVLCRLIGEIANLHGVGSASQQECERKHVRVGQGGGDREEGIERRDREEGTERRGQRGGDREVGTERRGQRGGTGRRELVSSLYSHWCWLEIISFSMYRASGVI